MARPLRLATRGSALARWQAGHVAGLLAAHGRDSELVIVETTGDRKRDVPIAELGGQGIFVKEVQAAVLDGAADVAVHSAKDLPSSTPSGLRLAAVPARGDPRDALVGRRLDDLPAGATVATGSVRRRAQMAWLRPDLTFVGLRGNMDTRVSRAGQPGGPAAVIVAAAALIRLGWQDRMTQILDPAAMIPQVAQGALGLECRLDDGDAAEALASIEDRRSRAEVDAERAFLAQLGGGCDLPVGALASAGADGSLSLAGLLCSFDGRVRLVCRQNGEAEDAAALGAAVARDLLDNSGGRALLADLVPVP